LSFNGLVLTDSLGMGAISDRWSIPEAAVMALSAGVDIIMISDPSQVSTLLDWHEESLEVGELKEEMVLNSVEKVFSLKKVDPCQVLESIEIVIN